VKTDLLQCPHFQQWIRHSVNRMNACLDGEEALTYAQTRMVSLSSGVAFLHDQALALSSERATTNLLARIQKQARQ